MKNIRVLPTNKPSKLFKDDFGKLIYSINMEQEQNHFEPQHLFITSDEVIKEGDSIFETDTNTINVVGKDYVENELDFKIILTTDPDLIKDGVQAIDDEFLEWFVKNPSCESVHVYNQTQVGYEYDEYHFILPEYNPKQETLEEAAEQYVIDESFLPVYKEECERSFKNGALWQAERIYSELELFINEVKDKIDSFEYSVNQQSYISEYMTEWFKQFKKK